MTMTGEFAPKILVVDDDGDIVTLLASILRDAGFTVTTASTGWGALEILENEDVDLMVTDVMLPGGLNGVELVIYARARYPALKSLFVSGHSDPVQDDNARDDFVAKPFRPRELLGCVYELLNRPLPQKQAPTGQREAIHAMVEAKVACLKQKRQAAANTTRLKSARGKAVPKTESILVVDDDPAVLDVAAMMIEDLGFTVLCAGDGAEALQLLEANPDIILLVTDVVMPGMDGWALARAAKQRHPDLKVLYMSGFIKNRASLPAEEYGPIISKPWRTQQFNEAVNRVLVGG